MIFIVGSSAYQLTVHYIYILQRYSILQHLEILRYLISSSHLTDLLILMILILILMILMIFTDLPHLDLDSHSPHLLTAPLSGLSGLSGPGL